uniref:Seminal fluid protein HACP013 n=1 Tax=Heliconius melpomene TaxID=34740 RepID=D9HQ72_HELME
MKSLLLLVLLCLLQDSIWGINGQKIKTFYVNNWGKYTLPHSVNMNVVKKLAEYILLYRDKKYCPFKNTKDCSKKSESDIIKAIAARTLNDEKNG